MQVKFTDTAEINGCAVTPNNRNYEVHIDGTLWGWVSGPDKGQPVRGKCWVALPVGAPQWSEWSRSREAAVLSAL
ncbi:hypothetical protein [Streptomyces sp. NPDC094144]|uniref:hypothetical protein n=1 Tax=Streptomyces sp. NPDC094144 TaxID=3366056 RepID=UPI0037F4C7D3